MPMTLNQRNALIALAVIVVLYYLFAAREGLDGSVGASGPVPVAFGAVPSTVGLLDPTSYVQPRNGLWEQIEEPHKSINQQMRPDPPVLSRQPVNWYNNSDWNNNV